MAACSREGRIAKTSARAPATRVAPVTDTMHGVKIVDRYRWLEGDNSDPNDPGRMTPEVTAWTDAQNSLHAQRARQPARPQGARGSAAPLMKVGSVTAPIVRGNRYFFSKREATQNQADRLLARGRARRRHASSSIRRRSIHPASRPSDGSRRPPTASSSRTARIAPATRTRRCTCWTSTPASRCRSRFRTGPRRRQWLPDGSGFVYQNLRSAKDPYSGQVMFHRMGTEPERDVVLFRQFTTAENAQAGDDWGPFGALSRDGRWLVLGYWVDTHVERSLARGFRRLPQDRQARRRRSVTVGADRHGVRHGDRRHAVPADDEGRAAGTRRRGRAPRSPARRTGATSCPSGSDAVIESVSFGRATIAVTYSKNASNVIEVFDSAGKPRGTLTQPGIGAASIARTRIAPRPT